MLYIKVHSVDGVWSWPLWSSSERPKNNSNTHTISKSLPVHRLVQESLDADALDADMHAWMQAHGAAEAGRETESRQCAGRKAVVTAASDDGDDEPHDALKDLYCRNTYRIARGKLHHLALHVLDRVEAASPAVFELYGLASRRAASLGLARSLYQEILDSVPLVLGPDKGSKPEPDRVATCRRRRRRRTRIREPTTHLAGALPRHRPTAAAAARRAARPAGWGDALRLVFPLLAVLVIQSSLPAQKRAARRAGAGQDRDLPGHPAGGCRRGPTQYEAPRGGPGQGRERGQVS